MRQDIKQVTRPPPRKISHRNVESAPTLKEQTHTKEPFYRRANHWNDHGARDRNAGGRGVPQACLEQRGVLQADG